MTLLTMPSYPNFTNSSFYLESNTQVFESPINKASQRVVWGGSRWRASFTLPAMKRNYAAAWQAFFSAMLGQKNTFSSYDPEAKLPRGASGGTPLVNGASQTGTTLVTDGWPNSTLVLKAGDYFVVNSELKIVTSDATSNGSGQLTISFSPDIRTSPSDNAPLTVSNWTIPMILASDTETMWETNEHGVYLPKSFVAFEALS